LRRKLTKEERKDKQKRKLLEDTSQGITVAVFRVEDMSHRFHRTKLDLNAQQNNLTGVCLEVLDMNGVSVILVEGGPKSVKRFIRLMTVRMKWAGDGDDSDSDESEEEQEEKEGEEGKFKQVSFNFTSVRDERTCEARSADDGLKVVCSSSLVFRSANDHRAAKVQQEQLLQARLERPQPPGKVQGLRVSGGGVVGPGAEATDR